MKQLWNLVREEALTILIAFLFWAVAFLLMLR